MKLTDFGLLRFVDPLCSPGDCHGEPIRWTSYDTWACGVVLYALTTRRLLFDSLHVHGGLNSKSWKGMLLQIAKCEYSWPEVTDERLTLWQIPGVKRIVEKLLVRNPQQQWRLDALWQDEWMKGNGAPALPLR